MLSCFMSAESTQTKAAGRAQRPMAPVPAIFIGHALDLDELQYSAALLCVPLTPCLRFFEPIQQT